MIARFMRQESGQVVVLVALAMSGLLLGVGLALDTGQLFVARRDAQSAADAAAWAGAVKIYQGGTAAAAIAAGVADAALNGFATGGLVTVTVVSPPTSGTFSGDASYAQVTITQDVATTFIPGATAGRTRITVRAVAGSIPYGAGYAILTLDPELNQAFKVSGSGNITVSGAGVLVNSNANQAAQLSGNGSVVLAAPQVARVVGQIQQSGSGSFQPAASTGGSAAADPYLSLPEPSISGQTTYTNTQISSDTCSADPDWVCSGSAFVLSPGVYDNGIKVSSSGATVRLNPGVYILRDGGFQLSGDATVIATGVMFFNTVRDHPLSTGNCDQWKISGNGSVTASAPTSGTYKGMLVWQDRDCVKTIQWSGNGSVTSSSGTIYGPNAELQISGNGDAAMNVNSQIVTKSLQVSGSAAINLAYTSGANAAPRVPALVD